MSTDVVPVFAAIDTMDPGRFVEHLMTDVVFRFGNADVEYLRKDGKSVTVPNLDVLVHAGDLVRDWQIYIDIAPVYA